jgi:hypothetical protein
MSTAASAVASSKQWLQSLFQQKGATRPLKFQVKLLCTSTHWVTEAVAYVRACCNACLTCWRVYHGVYKQMQLTIHELEQYPQSSTLFVKVRPAPSLATARILTTLTCKAPRRTTATLATS